MSPLPVTSFALASSLGHGVDAAVLALTMSTSGLRRNDFLDCALDTYIGRVEGIEIEQLPGALAGFDCRSVLQPAACGTRERVEIPLTDASHVAVEVG